MAKEYKVSFRLQSPYGDVLQAKADEARMSAHQYARLSVVRDIESTVLHQVKDQLLAVRAEVGLLRREHERLASKLDETLEFDEQAGE